MDLQEIKHEFQQAQSEELRKTQEEPELIRQELPKARAALQQEQENNAEMERRIEELKQRVRCEQADAKQARKATMQEQLRKANLEKQFYSQTCILEKATQGAVCLQMRGNIKVWVENAAHESPSLVRVCLQVPEPVQLLDPTVKIYPAFRRGLVECAWCRSLAAISGSSIQKLFGETHAAPEGRLEATVSCQVLPRFLRLLDVAVLQITDNVRALRNLRKEVPEVEWLSAKFQNGDGGAEPSAEITVVLSVIRSHCITADGKAKPLTAEAHAGKYDVRQCVLKFDTNLAAECDMIWSSTSVEPTLGSFDANLVSQAVKREATRDCLSDMLKEAVKAMQ